MYGHRAWRCYPLAARAAENRKNATHEPANPTPSPCSGNVAPPVDPLHRRTAPAAAAHGLAPSPMTIRGISIRFQYPVIQIIPARDPKQCVVRILKGVERT